MMEEKMDTYVYSNPSLNAKDEDRWLENLVVRHLRKDLIGNIYWVYLHNRVAGKLTVEYVAGGAEVYTTSLDILDKRVKHLFIRMEEKFIWNAFYRPKRKWFDTVDPDWHFLLASPRESAEEISAETCRGRGVEIAAVRNIDWIWTGYNGGPVDLYKQVGKEMVKYRTIVLVRHG